MNASGKDNSRRLSIGVLGGWLDDHYVGRLRHGVAAVAREQDVNVTFFAGHAVAEKQDPSNILYDMVGPACLDGAIIVGSIIGGGTSFYERFSALKVVSIGHPIPGVPTVLADNYAGMCASLIHLIEAHGCRRIAFIRGPVNNFDAEERFRAYRDVLKRFNLEFDEQLVAAGSWSEVSGSTAAQSLLDERKVRFDAIAAANDQMARGAMQMLHARGMRPPVAGFDDDEGARLASPPLTTVRQPIYELGLRGMEQLLAYLRGEKVPERLLLPTELVVRQSCGCLSQTVLRAASGSRTAVRDPFEKAFTARRQAMQNQMQEIIRAPKAEQSARFAGTIIDSLYAELSGTRAGALLQSLTDCIHEASQSGGDLGKWHDAISALRAETLKCIAAPELAAKAEDLFQQSRLLLSEQAQRLQAHSAVLMELQGEILTDFGRGLELATEQKEVFNAVANYLPALGINNCYIVLFDNQTDPLGNARLVLAYDERGQIPLGGDGLRFNARELLPEQVVPQRAHIFLAGALHYGQDLLGYIVFQLRTQKGRAFTSIATMVSSALKSAELAGSKKRTDERFMLERDTLSAVIENMPDWIFFKDRHSRFTRSNVAHAKVLANSTPESLLGKTDFDYFPLEVAQRLFDEEQKVMNTGIPMIADIRMITGHDGRSYWVSETKVPIRNHVGEVIGLVGMSRDVTELKQAEAQLTHQVFHDSLTRLPNRALFLDRLRQAAAHAKRREDFAFAVLFLDLDHFKTINDSLGHDAGDELLVAVARRLEGCVRPGDTLARLGGDEFTVLLYDIKNDSDPLRVADRILEFLDAPFYLKGTPQKTSASIGISVSTQGYEKPEDMLRDADTAMYRAKTGGKGRHATYDRAVEEGRPDV